MNQYGVRTTKEEQAAFPYDEYPLLSEAGTYTVTLVDKTWGKGMYLICAFVCDDGKKFRANVWRDRLSELYSPAKANINFATASIGSKWICTFVTSRNGYVRFENAATKE